MRTPRQIGRDAKALWRLCGADGHADERRIRRVVDAMIASRRAGALPILKQFLRLVKLDRARHEARIASAAPLDAELQSAVERTLAGRYRGVTATFVVDPSLIAGMRVAIGSDVYDGSVRAGLAALDRRFEVNR